MNRLSIPENQLTDILMSLDRNIRAPKNQPGDGIKRAGCSTKVSVVAIGTLTKCIMRLVDKAVFLKGLLLRRQQKIKTFLLADLIIDKVLINSVANTY